MFPLNYESVYDVMEVPQRNELSRPQQAPEIKNKNQFCGKVCISSRSTMKDLVPPLSHFRSKVLII